MKENIIKVVVKEVGRLPRVTELINELKSFQAIVDGYIEMVRFKGEMCLICNEEGKIEGLPINFIWRGDRIVGNVFFTADGKEGEFRSLTEDEIQLCLKDLSYV